MTLAPVVGSAAGFGDVDEPGEDQVADLLFRVWGGKPEPECNVVDARELASKAKQVYLCFE